MVRVAILRDARRARSFGMSAIALIPEMTAERAASVPAFALGHAHIWCDGLTRVWLGGFQNRGFV